MTQEISFAKILDEAKRNYFRAKVVADLLREKVEPLNAPIHKLLEEGKITDDEWAVRVTDNDFDSGYDDARELLRTAEDKLIETARVGLKSFASVNQWKQLEIVFTEGTRFIGTREKVIDLALKWSGQQKPL